MMNSVLAFRARQCGNYNWKQFDSVLYRLSAHNHDCWRGMAPSHFHADFNPEPPIFSAKFANCHNHRNILAIANEDGKIAVQNTNLINNDAEQLPLDGELCHNNAVFDLEWVPGQMQLVSASGDHTASLWQLRESKFEHVRSFFGHNRSVKTAAFRKLDPTCFATGGRDNAILIWDIRSRSNAGNVPKADNCIMSGHTGGPGTPAASRRRATRQTPKTPSNVPSNSITGLVFQDDYTLVSCGAGDGVIKVWDLRRNYSCYKKEPLPKYSIPYPGTSTLRGYTNLVLDSTGRKLYVNCMDHNIYCYNFGVYDPRPIMTYSGSTNSTFYIKSSLSPDDQYLISGSSDEKAYVWNVDNPMPLLTLSGHTREVTSVAWARTNDLRIVTCSDDARHNIWRLKFDMDDDDTSTSLKYRGIAEPCAGYRPLTMNHKVRPNTLENTPRSVKRLVDLNETTPNLPMKSTSKRSHSEMSADDPLPTQNGSATGGDSKRQLIETRARRLFAPSSTATPLDTSPQSMDSGFKSILSGIPEETSPTPTQPTEKLMLSPLNERNQINTSLRLLELRGRLSTSHPSCSTTALLSPTSNLPNYVIDGEAPHLKVQSPKRKLKENVDWLTKIRKQRQLSFINGGAATANDRRPDDQPNGDQHVDGASLNDTTSILSPRVRKIKSSEQSAYGSSPSRRLSICSGNNGTNESGSNQQMNNNNSAIVTTPKRRNSETTLLRFFCITPTTKNGQRTPTSTKNGQITPTTTKMHAAHVTDASNHT